MSQGLLKPNVTPVYLVILKGFIFHEIDSSSLKPVEKL